MKTTLPINHDRIVADLSNMIRIPSVNPFGDNSTGHTSEAEMADYYEAALRNLGLEIGSHTVSDGRRNVWGILRGTGDGPTVLLAGHLDTVGVEGYQNPFEPKVEEGKIFGRGSCDMKAGLAAYLEVARQLIAHSSPLPGDVIIVGVVDEEHAMAGSNYFGLHGPKVDFAIVAEPTGLEICPAHKGQILVTIKTQGVAAHSSMPEKGTNAIYHMAAVVQGLQTYAAELSTRLPDPMCGAPSFSVGVIRGGDNACSVPDYCEIDIDRRTIPGEQHPAVVGELTAVMDAIAEGTPDFNYVLETPFLDLPPLATPETSPIMNAVVQACSDVTDQATVRAFPGSTDAPNFNCPTVICGPGNLEQCHSLNEYVAIDQIEDAVRIYVAAILQMQTT
jgi:acetylornithine deacetylase